MTTSDGPSGSPFLVSPIFEKVYSKLFRPSLKDIAVSADVVSPSYRFVHPSAVFDEKELDSITATASTSSIVEQLRIARGQAVQHEASVSYVVENALYCDGVFYARRYRLNIKTSADGWLTYGRAPLLPGGVLAHCWLGAKYFGHSLHEEAAMAVLGQQRGELVGMKRKLTRQQNDYLDLFDVKINVLPERARLARLEILSDHSYSQSKVQRWMHMRQLFSKAANVPRHAGVFLARGTTGQMRVLVNEDEVANFFIGLGFKVINPGDAELPEIMAAVAGARIVVGVEGSQLVHGFFGVQDNGGFLVIQPPDRFDNAYKERCDLLGIKYSFTIASPVNGGFKVELSQLQRALQRLDNAMAAVKNDDKAP